MDPIADGQSFVARFLERVRTGRWWSCVGGEEAQLVPPVDLVQLWLRDRHAGIPPEIAGARPTAWTQLMCGGAGQKDAGLLAACISDMKLWPYREYLGLDVTGWDDHARSGQPPDRKGWERWCRQPGRDPTRLVLAIEHENDGFCSALHDNLDGLTPKQSNYVGSLDHSLQKLAWCRADVRIVVGYPRWDEVPRDELESVHEKALQLAYDSIAPHFRPGEDCGCWLLMFGYLVEDGPAKNVVWRATLRSNQHEHDFSGHGARSQA